MYNLERNVNIFKKFLISANSWVVQHSLAEEKVERTKFGSSNIHKKFIHLKFNSHVWLNLTLNQFAFWNLTSGNKFFRYGCFFSFWFFLTQPGPTRWFFLTWPDDSNEWSSLHHIIKRIGQVYWLLRQKIVPRTDVLQLANLQGALSSLHKREDHVM